MAYDKVTYNMQYNKDNYDRIELKVAKGKKAEWQKKAKAAGMKSLTEYITNKLEESEGIYFIADDSGFLYAHDIKGKARAEVILDNIIREYKASGEDIPEGIGILKDEKE